MPDPTPITDEAIAALERQSSEASPAPWRACGDLLGGCVCGLVWTIPLDTAACKADGTCPHLDCRGNWEGREDSAPTNYRADAMLIAALRNALPAMVARIRLADEKRDANAVDHLSERAEQAESALAAERQKREHAERERDEAEVALGGAIEERDHAEERYAAASRRVGCDSETCDHSGSCFEERLSFREAQVEQAERDLSAARNELGHVERRERERWEARSGQVLRERDCFKAQLAALEPAIMRISTEARKHVGLIREAIRAAVLAEREACALAVEDVDVCCCDNGKPLRAAAKAIRGRAAL